MTEINCPDLPEFALSSWESVDTAFAAAPTMHFQQHWLDTKEADFRPGHVRIGWRQAAFCFDAHLTDEAIFTTASRRSEVDPIFRPAGA